MFLKILKIALPVSYFWELEGPASYKPVSYKKNCIASCRVICPDPAFYNTSQFMLFIQALFISIFWRLRCFTYIS